MALWEEYKTTNKMKRRRGRLRVQQNVNYNIATDLLKCSTYWCSLIRLKLNLLNYVSYWDELNYKKTTLNSNSVCVLAFLLYMCSVTLLNKRIVAQTSLFLAIIY